MDEPIKNYPEYPVTLRAMCVMAVLLAVAGGTGVMLYRAADASSPKRPVQRTDAGIQRVEPNGSAAKRFERVPRAPDQTGLR